LFPKPEVGGEKRASPEVGMKKSEMKAAGHNENDFRRGSAPKIGFLRIRDWESF
jgi:hypothetical protein